MREISKEYLGRCIKYLRKKNNYTQKSLGKILGVTNGYLSEVENGIKEPTDIMCLAFSIIFRDSLIMNIRISQIGMRLAQAAAIYEKQTELEFDYENLIINIKK